MQFSYCVCLKHLIIDIVQYYYRLPKKYINQNGLWETKIINYIFLTLGVHLGLRFERFPTV